MLLLVSTQVYIKIKTKTKKKKKTRGGEKYFRGKRGVAKDAVECGHKSKGPQHSCNKERCP